MAPLVVLVTLFALLSPFGWWTALRLALAGMFLLTASAHWGKRRPDLIRMTPPTFPRPDVLVTVSGVLEILGAIGLIVPQTARYAAVGLALLLIAVFPANVRAARERLTIGGKPVPGLFVRTLLQVIFLGAAVAIVLGRRV